MEKEEEIEFWMPHPIYHIEASNFGRFIIRTNQFGATKITLGTRNRRAGHRATYEYSVKVQPRGGGKKVHKRAHQLVLECFLCFKYDDKTIVDHIDGDPENNAIDNLRWVNYKENNQRSNRRKRSK